MKNVLALILAGGKGTRLEPLTRDRAKPAVPFGGAYRIIDFALSNCINSGLRKVLVMTQYKAVSLDRHINLGWRFLCRELDEFIDILPPQQRLHEDWYKGTADAVYQNIYSIEQCRSDHLVILAGDHIYKMDYSELVRDHIESGAVLTIGCIPCSLKEGTEFGVMQVDSNRRIVEFQEKPAEPKPMPDDPTRCLVRHPVLITGYSRFSFVRASVILNCQSTPRCLALVLSAQVLISLCSSVSSPMRRPVRHWLVRQLSSHSATLSQLPCFGV